MGQKKRVKSEIATKKGNIAIKTRESVTVFYT